MKTGWKYKAKFVEKKTSKQGPYLTFQVSDYDKEKKEYRNYRCTAFEDVPLENGDEVRIDEILSVDLGTYKDKPVVWVRVKIRPVVVEPDETAEDHFSTEPLPFDL